MNLSDIVLNYLTDNEKGMQQLITWFLNDVMNEEVAQQAGVPRYARSSARSAHQKRVPATVTEDEIWGTESSETAVTRDPV